MIVALLKLDCKKLICFPHCNLYFCLSKVNNDHANCDTIGNELLNWRQAVKNKANEEIPVN